MQFFIEQALAEADSRDRDQKNGVPALRDGDGALRHEFIAAIEQALEDQNAERLNQLAGDLHEADLADLLEAQGSDSRRAFISLLGHNFDFSALTEVSDTLRAEILEELPNTVIASNLRTLDNDDAVAILENMGAEDRNDVLALLPLGERLKLQKSLDYAEGTAGRLMQTDFIAVPPEWTVEQTIQYCQTTQDLPDDFYEIFVVGPDSKLLGEATLNSILRADRAANIGSLMQVPKQAFTVDTDRQDVARTFQRYNLISAPVIDTQERLAGVLMIDDIVDVIEEEADADIKALGGVSPAEELNDNVFSIARGRFAWLFVNLVTAIAASAVIGLFEDTLQKMVALAILMPIVASQGGNAGTQTMTVAVRALATRQLRSANALRIVSREVFVGLINGVAFAVIMGAVAGLWFENAQLGLVIAFAMLANLIAAALAGVVIPIVLEKGGVDPAVASGTFVTTVTDIVGFSAFLATATLWFGL